MEFKEQLLETSEGLICYAEGPPVGPPLVWLHGVSRRWRSWGSHLNAFADRWQVFALDARGHGRSDRVPGKYSWLDHAADLREFVSARIREPAVLIGHSLGALQAVKAAADQADSVAGLVLEDPPLYAGEHPEADYSQMKLLEAAAASEMSADQILQNWPSIPWMTDEFRRDYAEALVELDPETLTVTTNGEASRGYDVDAHLGRIRCPTLLMRAGGLGAAITESEQRRALALLSHRTGITIEDCGHIIHAERPDAYRRAIQEFLAAL